jgi:hypothetical protein
MLDRDRDVAPLEPNGRGPRHALAGAAAPAGSVHPTMREPLTGITVRVDGTPITASTTIAALGANVLVLSSAVPERASALTSCYLARSDAALAVSELASDAHEERSRNTRSHPLTTAPHSPAHARSSTPRRYESYSPTAPAHS